MNALNKAMVLVLNRNWQAINVRTPEEAFCQMATDVATGLDIDGESMIPVKWAAWIKLPIRSQDNSVNTVGGPIRIPTVIVLSNYARVPIRRPRLSAQNIWLRDGGVCQYTGKKLRENEGNIDHVLPRSRGGKTAWENCVLADKRINSLKADKLPQEAGLHLLKKPRPPLELPATVFIRNPLGITDWNYFLP